MVRKTKQTGQSAGADTSSDEATSTSQDSDVDSPSAQSFADKAKDLDALREAVVDAAGVGAGLWLSYLFLFFYLFIAAAAVTHRDFLFENPIKLPFLDVELPFLGFFVLGPLLFLVLHTYVLLHFALLADKVGVFHAELQAQVRDQDTRTRLRRQLPSNIFVQYLAGPPEVRTGVMGFMLRLIALITLVIFPIALLVFFQLQFLPYHDAPITWWLRIAVLLDILLLWTLWPSIARGQASWISWHDFRRPRTIAFLFASLVPLSLVFTIATFPGEWLESNLPSLPLVPTSLPSWPTDQAQPSLEERRPKIVEFAKSMEWTSLHDLLVAGDVDLIARKPTSLWSNRLVLPGIDVMDDGILDSEEKSETLRQTPSLRGRRLERAVLIDSDLRRVDLTAAQLQGAVLVRADLREAEFGCASRKMGNLDLVAGPTLDFLNRGEAPQEHDCAQLQGANLISAQLQDANLKNAELQGANLRGAQLQGANLMSAELLGANLQEAELQGANLHWAQLQGANLIDAQLQGANLRGARLQGADLRRAELQGATLKFAELQGAKLRTVVRSARRPKLGPPKLQGADLSGANVWLAPFPFPDDLEQQSPGPVGVTYLRMSALSETDKADLTKKIQDNITDGDLQKTLLKKLNPILRNDNDIETWKDDEEHWHRYKEQSIDDVAENVAFLVSIACEDPEGHIAIAMAERAAEDYDRAVAKALLNETCEGAKALTKENRASLEKLGAE